MTPAGPSWALWIDEHIMFRCRSKVGNCSNCGEMAACGFTCWVSDCFYTLKSEMADARAGRSILSARLRKSQINHRLTQLAFCLLLDCAIPVTGGQMAIASARYILAIHRISEALPDLANRRPRAPGFVSITMMEHWEFNPESEPSPPAPPLPWPILVSSVPFVS